MQNLVNEHSDFLGSACIESDGEYALQIRGNIKALEEHGEDRANEMDLFFKLLRLEIKDMEGIHALSEFSENRLH